MELRTQVLVAGVDNLHDARYCAGMGVHFAGFTLTELNDEAFARFREIASWIEGVAWVVELPPNSTPSEIAKLKAPYIATEQTEAIEAAVAEGKDVFFKIAINHEADRNKAAETMVKLSATVTHFILSVAEMDSTTQNWLQTICQKHDVFLATAFTTDSIDALIEEISPAGIVLQAGGQIATGLNDFDELADILEHLDTDEFA